VVERSLNSKSETNLKVLALDKNSFRKKSCQNCKQMIRPFVYFVFRHEHIISTPRIYQGRCKPHCSSQELSDLAHERLP